MYHQTILYHITQYYCTILLQFLSYCLSDVLFKICIFIQSIVEGTFQNSTIFRMVP